MPIIELRTSIRAPQDRCFDLARSVDFHIVTAGDTRETAVGGRIAGLLELGETVTWRAKHFGIWQKLTVKLTAYNRPNHFQDIMLHGAFAEMQHDHDFEVSQGGTIMVDRFFFRSPFGLLGAFVDRSLLRQYMRGFLIRRAQILKTAAESESWRNYLP